MKKFTKYLDIPKSKVRAVISATVVCLRNATSPASTKHRNAPSYPAYGSALVHLPPGIFPVHSWHNLSELSPKKRVTIRIETVKLCQSIIKGLPIGLYLSINELTAQLGPKYLIADFT